MDFASLFVPLIAGLVGSGMIMYAKGAQKLVPAAAGLGLLILPYFVTNWVAQGLLCVALASVPFILRD
jgi:hypothetical protein